MMPNAALHLGGTGLPLEALEILAGSSLKITLLLLLAAGAAVALRRASAARRHLVWTVAVGAALATPLLSAVTPDLPVPLLDPRPPVAAEPAETETGEPRPAETETAEAGPTDPDPDQAREAAYTAFGIDEEERQESLDARAGWMELRTRSAEARLDGLEDRVAALELRADASVGSGAREEERDGDDPAGLPWNADDLPSVAAGVLARDDRGNPSSGGPTMGAEGDAARTVGGVAVSGAEERRAGSGPRGLGPAEILASIWAAGFLLGAGGLFLGLLRLAWIRRRATRITAGPLADEAERIAGKLGLRRPPVLLQGDDTAMPMTWGLSRASVLLPAGAEAWEPWRLEAVLLHEFAHVLRRDYLAQFAAHVACALYWFHPLVWIAAHRLRVEREHACDDVVVSAGTDAPTYARGLVEIARTLRVGRVASGAAALAMARPARLRDRLLALLDEGRDRSPLTARRAAAAWGLGLVLVLPVAALSPATGQQRAPAAEEPSREKAASGEVVTEAPTTEEATTEEAENPRPRTGRVARGTDAVGGNGPLRPAGVQEATALCGPADGRLERSSHRTDDDRTRIETRYGECTTSIRIEGDVRFDDDFSSVASLSRDGLLRLEVSRDGGDRRMEIRSGPGGRPEIRWWVEGRERPYDEAAERWLARALLDLFRTTGYKAEERVAHILQERGPEGVFAEVERMRSDHPRARYLQALLERGRLSPEQVRRAMETAARDLDSDHWLAGILTSAAERYSFDAATRTTFIRAAASLDSDHHQANVLSTALARDDLSRENLTALLEQAAEGIESDHHVANILTGLAERYPLEPELREPFLRAAATLESDHHQANVYGVILGQEGLRPAELAEILGAARRIESDHHLANVLMAATAHDLSDETLRRAFLDAARSLESAHHRANVLSAALRLEGLDARDLATILAAVREIGSDHNLANVLIEVSGRDLSEPVMQRAYLDAASGIESDHHLARVLSALVERDDVRPGELRMAIRAARAIGSDHNLAGFLIRVASRHELEGDVREEFMRTLEAVDSEHHHSRVASLLLRSGG